MMMGQIDHARNRIKAIKAEKRGKAPETMTILERKAIHRGMAV